MLTVCHFQVQEPLVADSSAAPGLVSELRQQVQQLQGQVQQLGTFGCANRPSDPPIMMKVSADPCSFC